MKMLKTLILMTTVLVALFCLPYAQEKKSDESKNHLIVPQPGTGVSETPNMLWPFYTKLLFEPYLVVPGPLKITILFSPIFECNSATLRITEIERLEFSGETEWTISATSKDTLSFTVNLNIPDNDTTGFRVEAEGCGKKQHGYYYFIAEQGKVKVRAMNLSRAAREMEKAARDRRKLNSSYLLRFERPTRDTIRRTYTGIVDESGIEVYIPADSFNSWQEDARDTAAERRIASLENEVRLAHETALQAREMLLGLKQKKMNANPNDYILKRFLETKDSGLDWRPREGITNEQLLKMNLQLWEERRKADTNQFREVIIDLRDPKEYESVSKLRGIELVPQEDVGYYKTVLPMDILYDLTDQGIRMLRPRPRESQINRPADQNQPNKSEEEPGRISSSSQSQIVIWSENFEGAFPTLPDPNHIRWYVDDGTDFGEGKDYWGKEICNVRSGGGNYSLWCSGIGGMPVASTMTGICPLGCK